MKCASCSRELARPARRAGISIFVMGDEYVYSYWYCADCRHYTVESYHDRFLGEDEVTVLPPVSQEVGDKALALIAACPEPFDKWCECASHKALYYGVPGDP